MIKPMYKNNTFTTIEDVKHPKSFKDLLGFLAYNKGRDCFGKFQGNVWKINREGTWVKVCRNIPDLSYKEYLKISLE